MKENQRGHDNSFAYSRAGFSEIILILIVVVLVGVVGLFAHQNNKLGNIETLQTTDGEDPYTADNENAKANKDLSTSQGILNSNQMISLIVKEIESDRWITFTHDFYGYKFNYRKNQDGKFVYCASISPVANTSMDGKIMVVFRQSLMRGNYCYGPHGPGFFITVSSKTEIEGSIPKKTNDYSLTEEQIQVDGVIGTRYNLKFTGYDESGLAPSYSIVLFTYGEKLYRIYSANFYSELLDQVLSTFEFTN